VTLRVAAFTPGPPSKSGGAVYAGSLLSALARRADVVAVSPVALDWDGPTMAPDDVHPGDFDVAVHFLGNNPEHLFAYRSAMRFGGVVACHDLGLRHVLGGFAPDDELADLVEQLGPERAAATRTRWTDGVATEREAFLQLLVNRPLRRARAVVVHSRFAAFVVSSELPWMPVYRVPSHTGALPPTLDPPAEVRARLGIPTSSFVVGFFGFLGGHKRVPQSFDGVAVAARQLERRGVDLRLVLVGSEIGIDVSRLLAARGLTERANVVGAVDDRAFFEHMAAVDAIVNLRYPTAGETSATLVQAQALAKPVVTTDYAQFAEERACLHVAPDEREVGALASALIRLATCGECARRVAETAVARAAGLTVDGAADTWMALLEEVHRSPPPAPRVTGPVAADDREALAHLTPGSVDVLRLRGRAGDVPAVLGAAHRALSSSGRLEWVGSPAAVGGRSWAVHLDDAGLLLRAEGKTLVADKAGVPRASAAVGGDRFAARPPGWLPRLVRWSDTVAAPAAGSG